MDRQAIFNKAYLGLKSQGFEKSGYKKGEGFFCVYRSTDGKKCAIGHCIPDSEYDPCFENSSISVLDEILEYLGVTLGDPHRKNPDISFLEELQLAHDKSDDADEMKSWLEGFAKKYDLTIPLDNT